MYFYEQVNDHNVTFTSNGENPDSYMALFPNIAERQPAQRHSYSRPLNAWDPDRRVRRLNPSGRVMPAQYFMFLETPVVVDRGQFFQDAFNVAIGFR